MASLALKEAEQLGRGLVPSGVGDGSFVAKRPAHNKSFIIKGRASSVVEQPIRKPWQDNENKDDS
jgi:hypothetical protein